VRFEDADDCSSNGERVSLPYALARTYSTPRSPESIRVFVCCAQLQVCADSGAVSKMHARLSEKVRDCTDHHALHHIAPIQMT
jgi:hypothetical protein